MSKHNKPAHDNYDIVIIGAGPAGLNAGVNLRADKLGLKVLLVDKMIPWEKPIPCAEGVGRLGFEEALGKVSQSWIRQEISKATFHSPSGACIQYIDKNGGFIINRSQMQRDLAHQCQSTGIECIFNCKVSHVLPQEHNARQICFENGDSVKTKIIIDCSGPIAMLGKGEQISWKPEDLEPAYFVFAEKVNIPDNTIHIYAGNHVAPGGYAWVFPRDKNSANIGIVIGKAFSGQTNLKMLLDSFVNKHFPEVKIVHRFAGSIPCGSQKGMALPGFFKAGDSASTTNPISRAGISEALLCGKYAGQYAIKMLGASTIYENKKICRDYEKQWLDKRGNRHAKLAKVKHSLALIPDRDYDNAAQFLSSVPREQLTMSQIFRASLGRFPRLVWALRHLM